MSGSNGHAVWTQEPRDLQYAPGRITRAGIMLHAMRELIRRGESASEVAHSAAVIADNMMMEISTNAKS